MMNWFRMIFNYSMHWIFIALSLIILHGCANPLPPSGGPRDVEGPRIIKTIPSDKTIEFKETIIMLEFNEYVDRNKVLQSLYFTPTVKYETSWSGKELEIRFTEQLRFNTTYSLTIGTDYSDYAGNRPTEAKSIIFSTGNYLDTGTISGSMAGQSLGVSVFLFPLNDSLPVIDPTKSTPLYKTQIGSNGQFMFSALSDKTYRIYAIQDMFKDGLYDIGTDAFSMTSRDVNVKTNTAPIIMKLAKPVDTISPIAMQAFLKEKGIIEIRCSEIIREHTINASRFTIKAKDGSEIQALAAYQLPGRPTSIIIEHEPATIPQYISLNVAANHLMDSSQNTCIDSIATKEILISEDRKNIPSIYNMSVNDSSLIDIQPSIDILSTHAILPEQLQSLCTFKSQQGNIPFTIQKITDNHISIHCEQDLQPDSWYTFTLNTTGLTDRRGIPYKDSVLSLHLKTVDNRVYGAMKGDIIDVKNGGPYILHLIHEKGAMIKRTVPKTGPFALQDIPSGIYSIECFEDNNNDGVYNHGSIVPFRFSERITLIKETITVRPRWTIDGIQIQFKEP